MVNYYNMLKQLGMKVAEGFLLGVVMHQSINTNDNWCWAFVQSYLLGMVTYPVLLVLVPVLEKVGLVLVDLMGESCYRIFKHHR